MKIYLHTVENVYSRLRSLGTRTAVVVKFDDAGITCQMVSENDDFEVVRCLVYICLFPTEPDDNFDSP